MSKEWGGDEPFELATGYIYGVRSFDIDFTATYYDPRSGAYSERYATSRLDSTCMRPANRARISAVFAGYTWDNGVNHCICGVLDDRSSYQVDPKTGQLLRNGMPGYLCPEFQTCSCGFYAYYRKPQHANSDTVQGIIRASGAVTLGYKGFRAQKAEIVALAMPQKGRPAPPPVRQKRSEVRMDKGQRKQYWTMIGWAMLWFVLNIAFMFTGTAHSIWGQIPHVTIAGFWGAWLYVDLFKQPFKGCHSPHLTFHRVMCNCVNLLPEERYYRSFSKAEIDSVKRFYPDAKIFDSYSEMMGEFHDKLELGYATATSKVEEGKLT